MSVFGWSQLHLRSNQSSDIGYQSLDVNIKSSIYNLANQCIGVGVKDNIIPISII